jgi:hypothetical protein
MTRLLATVVCYWALSLPAAAAEPAFAYIDLAGKTTYKLSDDLGVEKLQGNTVTVPQGEQTFEGIKFKIGEGVIQLGGSFWTDPPVKVEGITVGKKLVKLHILHATGYGRTGPGSPRHVGEDTPIGEYTLHYEDKSTETIPVVYGVDVRDWWSDDKKTSRSLVAWRGDNDAAKRLNSTIRLYLTTWENPKLDQKVVSIDYLKVGDNPAAPFCVALTAEEK